MPSGSSSQGRSSLNQVYWSCGLRPKISPVHVVPFSDGEVKPLKGVLGQLLVFFPDSREAQRIG